MKGILLGTLLYYTTQIIHGQTIPTSKINLSTVWNYNIRLSIGGPITHQPSIIRIIDSVRIHDTLAYVTEIMKDTLFATHDKMYFWDGQLNFFVLYYDFSGPKKYTVPYYNFFRKKLEIAEFNIESEYNSIIGSDTIPTQVLKIKNSQTFGDEHQYTIYKDIGAGDIWPKVLLGYWLIDIDYRDTIRCFTTHHKTINFRKYDCDSVFKINSVENIKKIIPSVIYKSSSHQIEITNIDTDFTYSIFNLDGRLIQNGFNEKIDFQAKPGIYILTIRNNHKHFTYKIFIP